jgi:hypothetical protein
MAMKFAFDTMFEPFGESRHSTVQTSEQASDFDAEKRKIRTK